MRAVGAIGRRRRLLALEILCEVVPDGMHRLGDGLAKQRVLLGLLAHGEEFLTLLEAGGVPQAVEVCARHGVDHVAPDADAHLAVLVENVLVELVLVDAGEAVVERADISEAAREPQATAAIDAR